MKKNLVISVLFLGLVLSGTFALAQQQDYGQGPAPNSQTQVSPWYGPGHGPGYGMGPGMMYQGQGQAPGWHGQHMGPGMMQGRQAPGPGMMHQGWQGRGPGQHMRGGNWGRGQQGPYTEQQQMGPMSQDAVRQLAEKYVAGNPNLQIGELSEQDDTYVATVVTKDGSLVEKLLIDKNSGWMKKEY